MTEKQKTGVLNRLICINLDIHIFSGRKQLRLKDLKDVRESQVPPRELASLGSKRICDGEEIQKFLTVKRRAERACEQIATRFLGAYACAESKIDELRAKLDECATEFSALKTSFLDRYADIIGDWKSRNPQWADLIESSQVPKDVVAERLGFDYQVFRIAEVASGLGTKDQAINSGLHRAASGLAGQLFGEVAEMASETYEDSFKGRDKVSQRSLKPIRAMLEKLDSLSFIDERMGPIVRRIRKSLDELPKTGVLQGNDLNAVQWLLALMSDADKMQEYGEAVLSGVQADVADAMLPQPVDIAAPSTPLIERQDKPALSGCFL